MDGNVRPVFLLSLPRSGSTMTQSVLAAHPGIATASEPWLLLPLLSTLDEERADADYNHRWAVRAIHSFAAQLPDGLGGYRDAIRRFVTDLYREAAGEEARWFVDKTPRYHLVLDELVEVFPDGMFVFLWRNPLGVVASMLRWYGTGWIPYRHRIDLFEGLPKLIEAATRLRGRPNAIELHYEDLVAGPEAWEGLFDLLDEPFDRERLRDVTRATPASRIGDPMQTYDGVSDASVDRWREAFDSPLRAAWMRRYLHWLGHDRLAIMGYDLDELLRDLAAAGRGPGSTSRAVRDAQALVRQRLYAWRSHEGHGSWLPPGSGRT